MVMATSVRMATARLCRAPGFRSVISRSPASIRRRIDSFIWRTDNPAQSIALISGDPSHATCASRRCPAADLPEPGGAGRGLAGLVPPAERRLEGDLLVGDGDGALALGHDQGLQAEGVLGEPEGVGGGGQVTEAAIEITHG